jgi:hypothetical protein
MAKSVVARLSALAGINSSGTQFTGGWEAFDVTLQTYIAGLFAAPIGLLSTLLSLNQDIATDVANGVNAATGNTYYTHSDVLLLGGPSLI